MIFSKRDCSSCGGDFELCFSFLEIGTDAIPEGSAKGGSQRDRVFPHLLPYETYETCEFLISSSVRR